MDFSRRHMLTTGHRRLLVVETSMWLRTLQAVAFSWTTIKSRQCKTLGMV